VRDWHPYRPPDGLFEINRASPQAIGLVGWWPPLRSHGISILHNMAEDYPGTIGPAVTWDTHAQLGAILKGDGSTSTYISTAFVPIADQGTVAVWGAINSANDGLVGVTGVWATTNGVRIASNTSDNFRLQIGLTLRDTTIPVAYGDLYHLVITGDGSTARFYINGVERDSWAYTIGGDNTDPLYLASIYNSSTAAASWNLNGYLGDVRIYDRALSPDEVWQLYDPATRWDLYLPVQRIWQIPYSPGGAIYDVSLTLARTMAISQAGNALAAAAHTLSRSLGMDVQASADAIADVGLGIIRSIASEADAVASAYATLSRSLSIVASAGAEANASVSLGRVGSITVSGAGEINVSLVLSRSASIAVDRTAIFDADLSLQIVFSISESARSDAGASLQLARSHAVNLVADAIAAAGLSLTSIQSVTITATAIIITVVPTDRTYVVDAESRTYTVEAESRTYAVEAESRTHTV